jgi:hypothetical protein
MTCPTDSHNQKAGQTGNSLELVTTPSGRKAGTRGSLRDIFTPPPIPKISRETDQTKGAEHELLSANLVTNRPEGSRQHIASSPITSASQG